MTAQTFVQSWFGATLAASLIALALLSLGRRLLGPRGRRIAWSVVLLKFILPPVFSIPLQPLFTSDLTDSPLAVDLHVTVENPVVKHDNDVTFDSADLAEIQSDQAENKFDELPVSASFSDNSHKTDSEQADIIIWPEIETARVYPFLACVWALGVMYQVALKYRTILKVSLFRKTFVNAGDMDNQLLSELVAILKFKSGRAPELKMTSLAVSPMLLSSGFFSKPVLAIPAELWQGWSDSEKKAVMAHELAHLKRRDDTLAWLGLAVECLQWPNPLARWATRQWKEAGEEAADALTLATLGGSAQARRDLAGVILQSVEWLSQADFNRHGFHPALAMANPGRDARLLKNRVTGIGQFSLKSHLAGGRQIAIVTAISMAMLPLGVMPHAHSTEKPDQVATEVDSTKIANFPDQIKLDPESAAFSPNSPNNSTLPEEYKNIISVWNEQFDKRLAEIREIDNRAARLQLKYNRVEELIRDEPNLRDALITAGAQFKSEMEQLADARQKAVSILKNDEATLAQQLKPLQEELKSTGQGGLLDSIDLRKTGDLVAGGRLNATIRQSITGTTMKSLGNAGSIEARLNVLEAKVQLIQAEMRQLRQARERKLTARKARFSADLNSLSD